jgi:hypothetical protein
LACASIAVPACDRIWFFVNSTISDAMSVSRIRLSDAVTFSTATLRLLIVCSNRFWYAPRLARAVETPLIAVSSAVIAFWALVVVVRSSVALSTARPAEVKPVRLEPVPKMLPAAVRSTWIWSFAELAEPTWNRPTVAP